LHANHVPKSLFPRLETYRKLIVVCEKHSF
jgi:hypothetical protein